MILTLFVLLVCLALAAIALGYLTDVPVYTLTGFAFMFLLSSLILFGNLEYRTGDSTTTTGNTSVLTYTYAVFNASTGSVLGLALNHIIGLYLAVASALGFVIVIADMRNPKGMRSP